MWCVPGDPDAREFETRDAALARAWELTPAGGQRAEPRQVTVIDPLRKEEEEEEIFDSWRPLHREFGGRPYVAASKVYTVGEVDLHRDAKFICKELLNMLRHEANRRGVVLEMDTLRIQKRPTRESGPGLSTIHVEAFCETRPEPVDPAEMREILRSAPSDPFDFGSLREEFARREETDRYRELREMLLKRRR